MNIPKNLDECFVELDNMNAEDVKDWLSYSEDKAIGLAHHGFGTMIRNEWGLWEGTNELCKYFKTLNIEHADDISGIILTSYHRFKNNKPFKIDEQVQVYLEHWKQFE